MDSGARKKARHHPHAISWYKGEFILRAELETAEAGRDAQGGRQH